MSRIHYIDALRDHLREIEVAIRGAEAEAKAKSVLPARRVELAGVLAVLSCRRRRVMEKLVHEESATPHLLDGLRIEFEQDFGAFEDFLDRMIAG